MQGSGQRARQWRYKASTVSWVVAPRQALRKLLLHERGFVAAPLRDQGLPQAVQQPAVARPSGERFAEHLLRPHVVAATQQRGAQALAHRVEPRGRFVVLDRGFERHGAAPSVDGSIRQTAGREDLRVERGRRQREQVAGLVVAEVHGLGRHCRALALEAALLGLRVSRSALARERHRPRVTPERVTERARPLGLARRENRVPLVKPQIDHQRIQAEALEHLHLAVAVADVGEHLLGRLLRLFVTALLGARVRDEVDIVRPVHQRIDARRTGPLDERAIGRPRGDVGVGR